MSNDADTTAHGPVLGDFSTALIRTVVPFVVGWVVAAFAGLQVTLDDGTVQSLSGLITLLVGAVYYAVVLWASKRWTWVGWLLGTPKRPSYVNDETPPSEVVNEPESWAPEPEPDVNLTDGDTANVEDTRDGH